MKRLNKNQWIAVFAGLALLAYILYAGPIMNLFSTSTQDTVANSLQEGLSIEDTTVGTGSIAEAGDNLTVHYTGTLEDGKVFDSSLDRNTPFIFTLGQGQVIRGWDEGLVGMRVGGRRIIIISPEYGYGAQGVGTIPPNSVLKFEIELLDVKKP